MSKSKYIIILLLVIAAMLCLVGASTWIITTPQEIKPVWEQGKKQVYIKRIAEFNYTDSGIDLAEQLNKIDICDENGNDITDENGEKLTLNQIARNVSIKDSTVSNGDIDVTDNKITVGSTYKIDNIAVQLSDNSDYALAGTYTTDPKTPDSDTYIQGSGDSYRLNGYLVKYKTVQIGETIDPNGTWYTIEEALNAAQSGGTVRLAGSNDTVETSFSNLPVVDTGYQENNFTLKSNVKLLMATSDDDTVGTNGAYAGKIEVILGDGFSQDESGTPPPTDYNGVKYVFSRLIVPSNINMILETNSTMIVGGISGAQKEEPHQNRLSGNYSEIELDGKITSKGELSAYGNIVGNGTIEATSGTVRERFETLDWSGGMRKIVSRYMGSPTGETYNVLSVMSQSMIKVNNPFEFPIEHYQLVAISAKLEIHYGVNYLGNARLFIGRFEHTLMTIENQFPVVDFSVAKSYSNNANGDGIFLLRPNAVLTKTVYEEENGSSRYKIEVSGGAVGGVAGLQLNALGKTFNADTSEVKFPVSSNLEISLIDGEYSFEHGYEFMGETNIAFNNKTAVKTGGASLIVGNKAKLTLKNAEDGIIFYSGSNFIVKNGGAVTIGGYYGGEIKGEEGGKLNFSSDAVMSASGYIAGDANLDFEANILINATVTFYFYGEPTTLDATGELYNGNGRFSAGTTYNYYQNAWRAPASYTVNFHANGENVSGISGEISSQSVENVLMGASYSDWFTHVVPPTVSRIHYTFGGWQLFDGTIVINANGELSSNDVTVTSGGQLDLYAIWTPKEYGITYDMDNYEGGAEATGGTITNENPATFNIESNIQLQEPIDGNLVFDAWYLDASFETSVNSIIGADILAGAGENYGGLTLYGRWYPAGTEAYTVTYHYNSDDYNDSSETVLSTNNSWSAPKLDGKNSDTTYSKYFVGWYIDGGFETVFDGTLNGDTDLYAKWDNKIQVIFKADEVNGMAYEYSAGWYYEPTEIIVPNINSMEFTNYYNAVYSESDYDVTVAQYFYGWTDNSIRVKAGEKYSFSKDNATSEKIELSACTETKTSIKITLTDDYGETWVFSKYHGKIDYTINIAGQTVAGGTVAEGAGTGTFEGIYYLHGDQLTDWSISITISGGYGGLGASNAKGTYVADADEKGSPLQEGREYTFNVTLKEGTLNGTSLNWNDTSLNHNKQ